MLNEEKWEKELKELKSHTQGIGVTHEDRPEACANLTDACFRCGNCKFNDRGDRCSDSQTPFEAWLKEEYHEPIPKLTPNEIEELKYYYHHGAVTIQNGMAFWYVSAADANFEESRDMVEESMLYCDYNTLDVNKAYEIRELLRGVTL